MIAISCLRQGNSYTTNNFIGFLVDTLSKLAKKGGLIRADSGFYGKELFDYLETSQPEPLHYIITAKFYQPIKFKLASQTVWMKLGEGIEIADAT